MSEMFSWILVAVLAVVAGYFRDDAKSARRCERDMAEAIAAEDGTVLEVLTKHGGKIGKNWSGDPDEWFVVIGSYLTRSASLAVAWADCIKHIRVQEIIEAEEVK